MDELNIIEDYFKGKEIFIPRTKRLFALFGSFADFDSFEYAQELSMIYEKLRRNCIKLIVIGIGSEKSKEYFCNFTKLDNEDVVAVENAELHNKLNLCRGLNLPIPSFMNLLIMCTGINSPGTIKEVLRGYIGDKNARAIFNSNNEIKIGKFTTLKGTLFDSISKDNSLRPFELATRRLLNMIEILKNWKYYGAESAFLTQRGATYIVDNNDQLIYKFISNSLLGYSETMNLPLSYLNKFITRN